VSLDAFFKVDSVSQVTLLVGQPSQSNLSAIKMDTTSTVALPYLGLLFLTYFDLTVFPDVNPSEVVCGVSQ